MQAVDKRRKVSYTAIVIGNVTDNVISPVSNQIIHPIRQVVCALRIYTIKDIARKAGVSVTTVSRVINNRPDVNKDTREAVLRIIEECHFVRNANARSLKQTDGELAAIVVRGRSNPFLNDIAERILQLTQQSEVSFLLEYIDEKDDEFQTALRLHTEKRATAFVMVGSRIDERAQIIAGLEVPFVFVTVIGDRQALPTASSVSIDDRAMGRLAVDYLLDRGHRNIAVFGARRDAGDSLARRYEGAMDAFHARGVAFDLRRYVECRFSPRGGYEAAMSFFPLNPDTTAVFAMSDPMAIGIIRALKDLGKRVPEDVSVFGFDGVEMGAYTIPSLTTIRQPVQELAQASVDVLLDVLAGGKSGQRRLLKAGLQERESVARICSS